MFSLSFSNQFGSFSSYVYSPDQVIFATVGSPLKEIRVVLNDIFGPLKEKAVATAANVPRLVAFTGDNPSSETLLLQSADANVGSYSNGEYVFACLQFTRAPTSLVRIQFIALDAVTGVPFTDIEPIRTGFVTVTSVPMPNFGLRFAATKSLLSYATQPTSAVQNIALPPIVVEVVDSLNNFDPSDSSMVIVATTSSGQLDPNGARETVLGGRATFSTLRFTTAAEQPVLTFTAFQTAAAVAGQSVSSGPITLTTLPIPEYEIAFSSILDANNDVSGIFQRMTFRNTSVAIIRASIVVRDSAHQPQTTITESLTLDMTSDEAIPENISPSQAIVDSGTACACANFTVRVSNWRPGYPRGAPIFFKFTVSSSSNPLLLGRTLTIGPITIEAEQQQLGTCAANLAAPTVVAELTTNVDTFRRNLATVTGNVAKLMGIENDRVTFKSADASAVTRVDPATLQSFSGTKVRLTFGEPLATSTNLKTSAQLASEFVALRPRCDAQALDLFDVYFADDDRVCDLTQFNDAVARGKACVTNGEFPVCQCQSVYVFSTWGYLCADNDAAKTTIRTLCQGLSACADESIASVCTSAAVVLQDDRTWLYVFAGLLGGVLLLVMYLQYAGYIDRWLRSKANLNEAGDSALD